MVVPASDSRAPAACHMLPVTMKWSPRRSRLGGASDPFAFPTAWSSVPSSASLSDGLRHSKCCKWPIAALIRSGKFFVYARRTGKIFGCPVAASLSLAITVSATTYPCAADAFDSRTTKKSELRICAEITSDQSNPGGISMSRKTFWP